MIKFKVGDTVRLMFVEKYSGVPYPKHLEDKLVEIEAISGEYGDKFAIRSLDNGERYYPVFREELAHVDVPKTLELDEMITETRKYLVNLESYRERVRNAK